MKLHSKHPSFFSLSLSLPCPCPLLLFLWTTVSDATRACTRELNGKYWQKKFFHALFIRLACVHAAWHHPRDIIQSRPSTLASGLFITTARREREETVTVLSNDSINRLLFSRARRERERSRKDSSRPIRITRETDGGEKKKKRRTRRKERRSTQDKKPSRGGDHGSGNRQKWRADEGSEQGRKEGRREGWGRQRKRVVSCGESNEERRVYKDYSS